MELPFVERIKSHFERTQHVKTAFDILHPSLRDYSYPPTKHDVAKVDDIEKQAARLKIGAGCAFILLTAYGIYYAIKPRDAFLLVARLVLHMAPWVWIAALISIIHFWERERCALTLRKWMDGQRKWKDDQE